MTDKRRYQHYVIGVDVVSGSEESVEDVLRRYIEAMPVERAIISAVEVTNVITKHVSKADLLDADRAALAPLAYGLGKTGEEIMKATKEELADFVLIAQTDAAWASRFIKREEKKVQDRDALDRFQEEQAEIIEKVENALDAARQRVMFLDKEVRDLREKLTKITARKRGFVRRLLTWGRR